LQSGLCPDRLDVAVDCGVDLEFDALLAQSAGPILDQLAADLGEARVAVLLTNERSQIVDRRVSEPRLRAALDRVLLAPGRTVAESAVGTNGMGTALAQRGPCAVEGDEHFATALTGVACAGAPVVDPRSGRILGVIGLTCLLGEASALLLPIAIGTARAIEQRLVEETWLSERVLLQRFLQERRRAKGPLVLVTSRTMITNAAADRLVEPRDEALLRGISYCEAGGVPDRVEGLVLSNGMEVSARVEPILESAVLVGTILHLRPAGADSRPHRGHPTFGWDSVTATEHSIIDLVAQGRTNRETGERLFLSHHTVGFHLRSIYRKLGITSRVDLTRLAVQHRAPVLAAVHGADGVPVDPPERSGVTR
jgi:DNA-binding CsgD family transcriptional regulator